MDKVLVIISTGFEELEAISIIDILRRGQIDVTISTINDEITKGAHSVMLKADILLKDISNLEDYDMVVLPGGTENAFNLAQSQLVKESLQKMKSSDKYIAAICAAPYALNEAKVLDKKYTCYPSFEQKIDPKTYVSDKKVVIDKKVITSQGPATAMQFALELVKILKGEDIYKEVKDGLLATTF